MANNKKRYVEDYHGAPPETLDGHPFFGLTVDDQQQIAFRDALWNPKNRFVAVDAGAGSGKTTLSAAVACLLCRYGRRDEVI